jgi:phage terminase large subunit
MKEQIAKSDLFLANYWSKAKVVVNQGGTSSGKTWSILDLLFFIGIKEKGVVITVVG